MDSPDVSKISAQGNQIDQNAQLNTSAVGSISESPDKLAKSMSTPHKGLSQPNLILDQNAAQ